MADSKGTEGTRGGAGLPLAVMTALLSLALALIRALSTATATAPVVIERIPPEAVAAFIVLVVVGFSFALLGLRERRRYREARRTSLADALTGVANRLAFEERLSIEWRRAMRHDRPLGVIMLDVDGLKEINDSLGHAAGDRVLRRVGAVLSERVRGSDLAARIGGDEFVVLSTETRARGLESLATSLRQALSELPATVSVGWAERTARDVDQAELLDRADLAMYRDKGHRRLAASSPEVGAEPKTAAAPGPG